MTGNNSAETEKLAREAFLRTLREIGERGCRHPALDSRSEDELLGYDDMLNAAASDQQCSW